MSDDWQEAGSGGESWKPENVGDSVTGKLVATKTDVGINRSNVYVLQEDGKDEPTSVWGSAVLDTKFQEIPQGSLVKIEFLGTEKGSGPKPYKNFRVLYKPGVPEDISDKFPGAENL